MDTIVQILNNSIMNHPESTMTKTQNKMEVGKARDQDTIKLTGKHDSPLNSSCNHRSSNYSDTTLI
ncbi:hypothetical protein AB833_12280 [Chromatiales bacterium (ex Bugula neritina AB1)]|nr:hypothetical protein AB833_12280 [Chromatiales bacterium (ex Bugula neritina AB1)]